MTNPSFDSTRLYGKSRDYIASQSVDYRRVGSEGYEVFIFRDKSFIEIDPHWGRQQAFAPNGWNITPRKD